MNKTVILIAASALALVALVLFQISWYKHSKGILEEQFNSTVSMAMALAIQNVGEDPRGTCSVGPAETAGDGSNSFFGILEKDLDLDQLDGALGRALDFYNINLDYEFRIINENEKALCCATGYCCSLNPFVPNETQSLQVLFPEKLPYLRGKMKFQLIACLLIILFVSGVFIMANYLLLQQKRNAQPNIDFFNNMAHEFNTPLTNIGLATKLISKKGSNADGGRFLNVIQNESVKLKQQVERFLQLMKMEDGSLQLRIEKINLNDLLQEVVGGMQLQVSEQNGHLQLHVEEGDVIVEVDRFHLGNAFRNLIDNAIKYAIDKPKIDVYLKRDNNSVSILFQDAGVGIPLNKQKQVFKKFQRTHTGDVHNQKGFGLGLAYVKTIVEAHQGEILLFSEINKGSRFDLHLPLNIK